MSKVRSSERFGPFVLLRRLDSDALGESWRAVEWKADEWGPTVVVHLLSGGDQAAIRKAAEKARPIVAGLSGTTVARHQQIGFTADTVWLAHEYPGGRSLQSVVNKARATASTTPNPIPVDQVLAIVEKLALSVESLDNVRYQGAKIAYGGVLPQFVWLSDEGEVRAAGQQIGPGILASLANHDVRKDYAAYFAPELRSGGAPSRASDVWSLGAILYLLLTGTPLPDPSENRAVTAALSNPQLMHRGEAVPAEILSIVRRALEIESTARYANAGEMRADLERLLNGGTYAPTTFNLAFYLTGLLRKEMETEAAEREKEQGLRPGDYAAVTVPAAAPATIPVAAPLPSAAPFQPTSPLSAQPEDRKRSALLPIIAIVILLSGGAAAAWFAMRDSSADAEAQTASMTAPVPAPAPPTNTVVEPVIAVGSEGSANPADPEATRQKAMEDAINLRLQQEMMKLQSEYERELQRQTRQTQEAIAAAREQNAPATQPSAPQKSQSASVEKAEPPPVVPQATTTAPPVTKQPETKVAAQEPSVPAQQPQAVQPQGVREGDLVAFTELDRSPEPTTPIRPSYPPIALRRRTEGSVILSVLINESGRVDDVRVLRGDASGLGFDEAAVRAVRQATFTPPLKDGKRVRTWKPIPVAFKP